MGQRINFAIHAAQAAEQQSAAAQIGGLADGRHIDVNSLAGLGKARQLGGHHHGGHVFNVELARTRGGFKVGQGTFHAHTQTAEQGFHALRGKGHVRAVACALQTYHQTVTNELVGAHGGHGGQIFDAIGHGAGAAKAQEQEKGHPRLDEFWHDGLLIKLIKRWA